MSEPKTAAEHHDEPGIYEIRVQEHLDERWAARFAGMTLTRTADGATCLTGPVVDQAALHGLLRKVRDLGLTLLAVGKVKPGPPTPPHDPA